MPAEIIDTHVHIWNFTKARYEWLENDTSILHRNFDIEALAEERLQVGVTGGVLIQAANNVEDTEWMLTVAAQTSWIKGVVGWLPLKDPDASANMLNNYRSNKYFKGVRHLIHDEADTRWLLQEEVIESLQILARNNIPYDLVGLLPDHIETALAVAEKVPGLRMIFDHLNQPPISAGERFGRWGELMREAARNQNCYVKISGLGTCSQKSDWAAKDIEPYVAFAIENFGVERCVCGGDWPVCLLAESYTATWKAYRAVINSLLNQNDAEKLLHKNAVRFYDLT